MNVFNWRPGGTCQRRHYPVVVWGGFFSFLSCSFPRFRNHGSIRVMCRVYIRGGMSIYCQTANHRHQKTAVHFADCIARNSHANNIFVTSVSWLHRRGVGMG